MKRPKEKDYFEFRGDQIIIDYGGATNFIDALDEYCDELKEDFRQCSVGHKILQDLLEKKRQELQTLKEGVRKYIYEKEDNYPKLKELIK